MVDDAVCPACGKLRRAAVLNATGVPLCFCVEEGDSMVGVSDMMKESHITYDDILEYSEKINMGKHRACCNCHWWQDGMCMNINSDEWCGKYTIHVLECEHFEGKNDKDILSDLSHGDLGCGRYLGWR